MSDTQLLIEILKKLEKKIEELAKKIDRVEAKVNALCARH